MPEYQPVSTIEDLANLDQAEVNTGYWSGRAGDPEPSHNLVSRSFWHGWRNGAMDAGHLPHDAAASALARAYLDSCAQLPAWVFEANNYPPQ